jgi:hypothetical protein
MAASEIVLDYFLVVLPRPRCDNRRIQHYPDTLTVLGSHMTGSYLRVCLVLSFLVPVLTSLAVAENIKIEGFIVGRNGDEMTVKFGSEAELTFVLTDDTDVSQMDGVPKEYRRNIYTTLLIPGLKVQVEGTYNEQRQVIATKVKFKERRLGAGASCSGGDARNQNASSGE